MSVELIDGQFLRVHNGPDAFVPTASEIFSVVFENVPTLRGVPSSVSEFQHSGLQFSRYLADPVVVITAQSEAEEPYINCQLVAKLGSNEAPISHSGTALLDYAVGNGLWMSVPSDALIEAEILLTALGLKSFGRITLAQYIKASRWNGDSLSVEDRTATALAASRMAPALSGEPPIGFIGKLFPYQLNGYRWLSYMVRNGLGGIIADEMGLGKTVQVICVLLEACEAARKPNLVIAPNTLLENWRREILRFAPKLRVLVHSGSRRSGLPMELSSSDVLLCSYDTAVSDAALFRNVAWNLMVIDEAQGIKNAQTRRATQLKTFPRVCSVAMTGTPIENRLQELWSITDLVLPSLLGSASDFERRYPNTIEAAASLEPVVSPLILRRTVAEVATDLPERIDIPQPLQLDGESAKAYEAIRNAASATQGTGAGLAALQKLRMFCTHPWLAGSFTMSSDPTLCSVKLQRLIEIMEEVVASRGKAIVFTSYTESIDLIRNEIEARLRIYSDSIDGRVPVNRRQEKIDKFSSNDGAALLVLNPKAAGVGLNITAANHVIHFNLEWNPAIEDQASARAHRRGQTRVVTVHRLYYANTVEEIIDDRMQRKRELSGAAIVGTTGQATDIDDIMQALRISPIH